MVAFRTTNYLYDGFQLIEEADQGGTLLARYTMDQGIDEPLAQFRSGTGPTTRETCLIPLLR